MSLRETLYEAMREPRRRQMMHWAQSLETHRRHAQFRTESWIYSREVGFSCGCSGCDQEWRINLSSLRSLATEAQEQFQRLHRQTLQKGTKQKRRQERKACVKAKALLHSQLTREQRWQMRGERAFTLQGRDGRTYRITEGSTANVQLIENGLATHSFCVVDKDRRLPVYDLMLAQKLLLESNPEGFHKIAVVRDLREHPPICRDEPEITDGDLEDPTEWVRERIAI